MTHRKILYWLAFSDGIALLALVFVAVPLKYLLDQPLGVKLLGPLHGTLFLSLAVTTLAALGRGLLRPGGTAREQQCQRHQCGGESSTHGTLLGCP